MTHGEGVLRILSIDLSFNNENSLELFLKDRPKVDKKENEKGNEEVISIVCNDPR